MFLPAKTETIGWSIACGCWATYLVVEVVPVDVASGLRAVADAVSCWFVCAVVAFHFFFSAGACCSFLARVVDARGRPRWTSCATKNVLLQRPHSRRRATVRGI